MQTRGGRLEHEDRDWYLHCLLVSTTGLLPQLTGGYGAQLNLNNSGTYYDVYYMHPQEVAAVAWLYGKPGTLPAGIQVDDNSDRFAFTAPSEVTGSQYLIDDYPTTIQSSSWVILDYSIVQSDLATAFVDGDLISYKYPTGLLQRTKNLVYSNGKTKIYSMRHAVPAPGRAPSRDLLEGIATGVAYGAGLWCGGALLVASFRPNDLVMPYWDGVSWLRTDTSGVFAFVILAVSLCTSEYLRLRRKEPNPSTPSAQARCPLAAAIARTVALLSTVLVVYLSVNAVTHPATLARHATHFASWPTEGTVRVCALALCIVSVGWLRFSSARLTR